MKDEALKDIPKPESIESPVVDEDVKSQLPEPKGLSLIHI